MGMTGWTDYGFPNPELYSLLTPVTGIIKALNERRSAVGLSIMQIPDRLSKLPSISRNFMIEFERAIIETAPYYVDPSKYDPQTMTSYNIMRWNYSDLRDTAAGGYANRVEPSDPYPRIFPEWPAAWLKQVKKMIDLLRYPAITANLQYLYGSASLAASKQDAYNTAISDLHPDTSAYNYLFSAFKGRKNPSSETYNFELFQLETCAPVVPAEVTDIWCISYIDGYDSFSGFGTGLTQGWNRLKAENGYFIRRTSNIPYQNAWDSVVDYTCGFLSYAGPNSGSPSLPLCYADFDPIFTFKEDE